MAAGGCTPGFSGSFGSFTSRYPGASLLRSLRRRRALGWGGTHRRVPVPAGFRSPLAPAAGTHWQPQSPAASAGRTRSPLHCGAGSLVPGRAGRWERRGALDHPAPGERAWVRSLPTPGKDALRRTRATSPFTQLDVCRLQDSGLGGSELPWYPESGWRRRGAEFTGSAFGDSRMVLEPAGLHLSWVSLGEVDTFVTS